MVLTKITSLIILITSFHVYSFVGEFNSSDYYNTHWPENFIGPLGEIISFEETRKNNFINISIESKIFDQNQFFLYELVPSLMCPKKELREISDKLRFSFRAVAMSLIYEELINRCQVDLNLVNRCSPSSGFMKKHLKAIKASYSSTLWKKENQVFGICEDCNSGYSCKNLKNTYQNICSEKDHLFGMSNSPLGFALVKNSKILENTFEYSNYGCVKKYSLVNRFKEYSYKKLPGALLQISEKLNTKYRYGRSIVAQVIDSYKDKGIEVLENIKSIKPMAIVKAKPVRRRKKTPKKKGKEPAIKKVVLTKIIPPAPEKLTKSAFYRTSEMVNRLGVDKMKVDMNDFYFDYVFSSDKLAELAEKLALFTKVKSLKVMKEQDKLGTNKAPIPLIFIKFLIDSKNHQALYNLIHTVGERFMVLNDIDELKTYKKVPIELKIDENGSFNWYLTVLNQTNEIYDKEK